MKEKLRHSHDAAEPVRIPIGDELDLHTFAPADCEAVLEAYLGECQRQGLLSVRVIHGKGTGAQRARVLAWAARSPLVRGHSACDAASGGWGALRIQLFPAGETRP